MIPVWQDVVFFVGGFLLAVVLYPVLRDEESAVPRWTSIPTAAVLYAFAGTYYTLGLYLAMSMNAFSALMWTAIALWRHPNR